MWTAEKVCSGQKKNMCGGLKVGKTVVCMREESAWGQLGFLWALKSVCFLLSQCVSHTVV